MLNSSTKEKKKFFVSRLKKIIKNEQISRGDADKCMRILLDHELGDANDVCFGAFFAALQTKQPHLDEVAGLMDAVMNYDCRPLVIKRKFSKPLCGIIGSGKDDIKTFNISTISSIVAAAAGAKIIKNGSRSESSIAGTTDVLEKLGVNVLNRKQETLERAVNELNFGFCDAQPYFPRMVKEYLGKFFFVHPLSYILPVASGIKFDRVLFGLASDNTEFTAQLLLKLGYDNSIVVAGHDMNGNNFDEISNIGPTKITEIKSGVLDTYTLMPSDFGIPIGRQKEIAEGYSVEENSQIFKDILNGIGSESKLNIILINAGTLLYVAREAESIKQGMILAKEAILSEKAKKLFADYINLIK